MLTGAFHSLAKPADHSPSVMNTVRHFFFIALSPFLLHAHLAQAQKLQANLGMDFIQPLGDFADGLIGGVGPTAGMEYVFGERFSATFDVGYVGLITKDGPGDALRGGSVVPLQIGSKFYIGEARRGPYFHILVGAHSINQHAGSDIFSEAPKDDGPWRSSLGVGFGSRMGRFDLAVRSVFLFTKTEEHSTAAPAWSYIGLHAAYGFGGR
jgi:hypothetical protein